MLFDIHTHISQFNHDELDLMIERWQANNMRAKKRIVCMGEE